MAYDEGLAERIRGVLNERRVKGHMSVGIVQDKLMVRVGYETDADLRRWVDLGVSFVTSLPAKRS